MKKICLTIILVTTFIFSGMNCTNQAAIGASCDTSGSTEECVTGGICDGSGSGHTCRKICTTDAECSASEACNGVSSSTTKACKPK